LEAKGSGMKHWFAAISFLAAPLHAEDLFVLDFQGVHLEMPAPIWENGKTGSEVYHEQGMTSDGKPIAIHEVIPKGETFEEWTELFAAMVEAGLDHTIGEYAGSQIESFRTACQIDEKDVIYYQATDTTAYLVIPCGKDNTAQGLGEVGVFYLAKVGGALVKIYHEWRGPSFDPSKPDQWPVGKPEFDAFYNLIERGTITVSE
jgi:hypothetical protein